MRKHLLICTLALLLPLLCAAQKTVELYYVAHDHFEKQISDVLDLVRRNARYNPDRTVVFYLANRGTPEYFKVSPEDDRKYDKFMETLNSQTSHTVSPADDRLIILDLFSEGRFLGSKGFDGYDRVVLNFYINPSFVQMDYCDELIGRLYWDMDLASLPAGKLEINIYHHEYDGGKYDEGKLFGRRRLLGRFEPLVDSF